MKISLSPQQQAALFEWSSRTTEAHADEDCEPPSYTLEIHVSPALPTYATACSGSERIDLGEVEIEVSN